MPTADELRILRTEIEADINAVGRLLIELGTARGNVRGDPTEEQLAHVGYLLHSVYTGWESAFHRIATTFENKLDAARWHEQLLLRMTLDIPRIRPAVIPPDALEHLAALKSFRHFFRYSYATPLRWNKMQLAVDSVDAAAAPVQAALRQFLVAVEKIADQS